jgi:hypothetical protein
MSRSDTLERAAGLPPLLVQIVKAALDSERFDPGNDRTGHADALVEFGHLAGTAVPARGALAPIDNELYTAFDEVAAAHLGLAEDTATLDAALKGLEALPMREPISAAANALRTTSDVAYFYGGLAFGITLACLGETATASSADPGQRSRRFGRGLGARRTRRR